MSFGQHLEELRGALFRSILGLVVGVLVGLWFGGDVVEVIQRPLANALENYYQKQSLERARARVAELQAAGKPLPMDPEQLSGLVMEEQILPDQAYVDPDALLRELREWDPKRFGGLPAPTDKPKEQLRRQDLLPMFLWRPMEDDIRVRVRSLSAHEAFSIYMKASILVGIVITSPWIFYQLWLFVGAGLYRHERRYVHIFLPFSLFLFLAGVALAFFFVFKPVLAFLFGFNDWMKIDPEPRISEWLSFVLILPLGFGIGFQLPLVMLFLERIGVFTVAIYRSHWRISVLIIAVIAMILTPPDPYSMVLMGGPLTLLYFGGIWLCKLMPRMPGRPKELDEL